MGYLLVKISKITYLCPDCKLHNPVRVNDISGYGYQIWQDNESDDISLGCAAISRVLSFRYSRKLLPQYKLARFGQMFSPSQQYFLLIYNFLPHSYS